MNSPAAQTPEAPFAPTALPAEPEPRASGSRLRTALAAVGVVLLAAAAVAGIRIGWAAWQADARSAAPGTDPAALVPTARQPASSGVAPERRTVVAAPALQAALHLAGQAQPLEGDRVALASGARFDVRVKAPVAGTLEVYALPASGQPAAMLWSAEARGPGHALRSPMLRLEGERGVEKLRLLLRGPAGEVLALHEIRIWHL